MAEIIKFPGYLIFGETYFHRYTRYESFRDLARGLSDEDRERTEKLALEACRTSELDGHRVGYG